MYCGHDWIGIHVEGVIVYSQYVGGHTKQRITSRCCQTTHKHTLARSHKIWHLALLSLSVSLHIINSIPASSISPFTPLTPLIPVHFQFGLPFLSRSISSLFSRVRAVDPFSIGILDANLFSILCVRIVWHLANTEHCAGQTCHPHIFAHCTCHRRT